MPLFDYRLAVGSNVALNSLTNIETITVAGKRFFAPQALGNVNPGVLRILGNGKAQYVGFLSTIWLFAPLWWQQYFYLDATYDNRDLTIYTPVSVNTTTGVITYGRYNAIMRLPKQNEVNGLFAAPRNVPVYMERMEPAS